MKLLYSLIAVCSILSCNTKKKVDLIVHHAVIYTIDSSFSIAAALAVNKGKIVAAGSNEAILEHYTSDNITDAKGKFIYPGFIDAHAHFYGYALSLQEVDLTGTKSWDECIVRIKDFVKTKAVQPGQWIIGRGWDQNDWHNKAFPDKARLDAEFPGHPVLLTRIDGHAAIASQMALTKAGVQPGETIAGGLIEVNKGRLTGILVDNAVGRVSGIIPEQDAEVIEAAFKQAENNCFAAGLTTIVDCGLMKEQVSRIDTLQKNGTLRMKIVALLSDSPENYDYYLSRGVYKTDRLHVNGFKLFADGALGSRGACLLQPYHDRPDWKGFLLSNAEHYKEVLQKLYDSPFQACTHAIGDSANRAILKLYAGILKGKNDRRWRIEHAQVIDSADFDRFGNYSIIPSVQPTHATSDMYWAADRLGANRMKGAYAYHQLLLQNGWIALGTDFPVEDISPFKTFYAAVVRKDIQNFPPNGFQTENALTKEQALKGITIWAAKGSFEEKEKGSIEKGKWADFIITDTDIMQCDPSDILNTQVLYTYVNGEKVYESK
ncbi:amidohydrolase [Agriterribacter sp.]|uniref:amidohydrolase n=1 Tax=Agriterribacter sp. TaxID=2821509 RepID=UPI002C0F612D|nr:amidohydrolase [Agriterribacter sp.]HRO44908.1 amidohydrolase [Agriterribacter sp.]HRQ15646.1 amidohydrolase [Agriterribacter sp.]